MCQPFGEDNDYDKYLITIQRWILMIKTRCNKSLYTLTKKEIIPPPKKFQYLLLVQNHLLKKETKTKISLKSQLHPSQSPQFMLW